MKTIYEKGDEVMVFHEGKSYHLPIDSVSIEGKDIWYRFKINPSNYFSVNSNKIKIYAQDSILNDIFKCMVDLHESDPDIIWVNCGETLWERLASIYENHGGDMSVLKSHFSEYF